MKIFKGVKTPARHQKYHYSKKCAHAKSLHCVQLFVTPWTIACQVSLSMGFSRQESWTGLPCPPPGDLLHPGMKPRSVTSPALAGRLFITSITWEALFKEHWVLIIIFNIAIWLNYPGAQFTLGLTILNKPPMGKGGWAERPQGSGRDNEIDQRHQQLQAGTYMTVHSPARKCIIFPWAKRSCLRPTSHHHDRAGIKIAKKPWRLSPSVNV